MLETSNASISLKSGEYYLCNILQFIDLKTNFIVLTMTLTLLLLFERIDVLIIKKYHTSIKRHYLLYFFELGHIL